MLGKDDPVVFSDVWYNIGYIYTIFGDLDIATEAYKLSLNYRPYNYESLNNLAVISIEKKDYESAVGNCLDALKVKDIMGNEIEKTDSYINLAKAYFYLNDVIIIGGNIPRPSAR